jgi:hypothetical protein
MRCAVRWGVTGTPECNCIKPESRTTLDLNLPNNSIQRAECCIISCERKHFTRLDGPLLGAQMKLDADNVGVIVLPNIGHWILEEKPKETTDALVNFL